MPPLLEQTTVAREVELHGVGYFSNQQVRVRFVPAEADTGWVFCRRDLEPAVEIPVAVARRVDTPRRTTLGNRGAQVQMVEHVLSALHALGVHNCRIELWGPELPGCDGSCAPYAQALEQAGLRGLGKPLEVLRTRRTVWVGDNQAWVELRPSITPGLHVRFILDYPQAPAIGRQVFCGEISPRFYIRHLAPARTFLLWEEAQALRKQGIGRHATAADLLVFDQHGVVDNTLRFPDECVRHKVLDLVGDLALAGRPVWGQVVAYRSGHRLNAQLVKALLEQEPLRKSA